MAVIAQAETSRDLDAARGLMRDFVAWARVALAPDTHLVDRYFAGAVFEAELAGLPGRYAPPQGRLLLARAEDGTPLGVVALRDLGEGTCEMKRMFVAAPARGTGLARLLVDRLLDEARAAGYARMRLDTSHHQVAAQRLYERAGFRPVPPYYDPPAELRDWLRYYERDLTP